MRLQLAQAKKVEDDVVASVSNEQANFENVILPRTRFDNELTLEIQINAFYQYVSTEDGLREPSRTAAKMWSDYAVEASMREDIFALVDAVLKKDEKLDPESKLLLEKEHKAYIRNGLSIPAGPKRDRFKEIKKRLTHLIIQFEKTLNEETDGLWLAPEELDGVPKDLVSSLKKGEGENEGKVWLTFKYPDLFPTLRYANNATIREKYFVANENKCNSNCAPFTEIMILRDEAARLLGYNNHAEFKLEDKMAKTPKTVNDFLADLRQRLTPLGEAQKKVLLKLKEDDLKAAGRESEIDGHYYLWDHRYYDRLMVEKDYDLDQEKVSEWFPVTDTINGMLKIFEELFGLRFVEIVGADRDALSPTGKGSDIVWHQDVILYSVWDDEGEGGGFVGYLYLDLHPRDGKYGHAANFGLHPGYIDANGKRRYPVTALVCNFSKPTAKKPSLLKHSEVVTLFHELGHGIHDLVGRTIYAQFHGTSTVRDFVECPSQMLENWCWEPAQLKNLSRHYSYTSKEYAAEYTNTTKEKIPEKIPDGLIEKVIKTRHVNDALFNLRQLHFGLYDMFIHQPKSHEDVEKMDFSETYNKMRAEFSGMDGLEIKNGNWSWGNGQACFGHLVGGYDAGYYGYLRYAFP